MYIIGVAGGTGSGKTSLLKKVAMHFKEEEMYILPQDAYYKNQENLSLEERIKQNYDQPDAIDFDLLIQHVNDLKNGKNIEKPNYSFAMFNRLDETTTIKPTKILIVEGILVLNNKKLTDLFDLNIYIEADADERILRVVQRDIVERGRSVKMVIDRYLETVKPMHSKYIGPSKQFADVIIPKGANNKIAIDLFKNLIHAKINMRGIN